MKNISCIHPYLISRGGSQRYFLELSEVLKENNYNVKLYTHTIDFDKTYKQNKLLKSVKYVKKINFNKFKIRKSKILFEYLKPIISLIGLDIILKYINAYIKAVELSKIISIENNDILLIHEEPMSYMVSHIIKKKFKKIEIYWLCYDTTYKWFYEWEDYKGKKYFIRNYLLKLIIKLDKYFCSNISKVFVLDENIKTLLSNIYHKKSTIVGGGINSNNLILQKKKFTKDKLILENNIIISCITRVNKQKKILELINFFLNFYKDNKNIFLYLNATEEDESLKKEILNIIDNNKPNNLYFDLEPFKNDEEMTNVYLSSDIFIYPSINQTWGHAALEASSLGCLSIINSGSGIYKALNLNNKNIFQSFDNDLFKKLNYYIDNKDHIKKDSKKQKLIIKNEYTWEKIIKKMSL